MEPNQSPMSEQGPAFKIVMTLLPIVIVVIGFGLFWWPEHQQDKLRQTGVPATGTIIDIEPTGTMYNDQPQVKITISIHPSQGQDFTAETKMIINQVYLPRFQPGAHVEVHYDADDHSKVAID